MPEPAAIAARDLGKRYGASVALRAVTLSVGPGERVAILGPNGSGKTTLLRILAGLTRPTTGQVHIGGYGHHRGGPLLRRRIGVMGHHTYLYDDLTAEENLLFYARVFGLDSPGARVDAALARAGLERRRRDRVRALSRGMQQRLALARAVLHDPEILLLDEPDTGLDREALGQLGAYLVRRDGSPRTVVLATHNLPVGLAHCQRYVILSGGRMAHEGPVSGQSLAVLERLYGDRATSN